jgi:hypothetical protein
VGETGTVLKLIGVAMAFNAGKKSGTCIGKGMYGIAFVYFIQLML